MKQQPEEFIPTRQTLLDRLKNWEDQDSWQELFLLYKRLIFSTALRSGLTETESDEVVQETLIAVARTIKDFNYDPKRCTFKTWLGHLTRKRIADQFRKRARIQALPPTPPDSGGARTPQIERIPDPNGVSVDALWDEEWQTKILSAALHQIKKEVTAAQYQIFDFYVVRKMSASEVAGALGTSIGQVYLAKHRVSKLLKKEVKRMEAEMNRGLKHE